MRTPQEGRVTLWPKPPTTIELDLAVDISKFTKALEQAAAPTAMEQRMAIVQAAFDDSRASMDELAQMATEAAAVSGGNFDDIKAMLEGIRDAARPHYGAQRWGRFGETADQELNRRLNMRMRGETPGPPINWKGITVTIRPKPWWQR